MSCANLPIAEVTTPYRERPPASASKLRTIPDGIRSMRLVREERPLDFLSSMAGAIAFTAVALSIPLVTEYLHTGLVPLS